MYKISGQDVKRSAVWVSIRDVICDINFHGKTVYEFGCGTGKYTAKISDLCDKLYANDISSLMIEKAKEKCSDKLNIEYINASVENSGIADESIDVIFGAWVGTQCFDNELIESIEQEFSRILKKDGTVWIFENYLRGEFTQMRGIYEPSDPVAYFIDKLGRYGYCLIEFTPAYWQFQDIDEAKHICGFIFGDNAVTFFDKNGSPIMEDNIAIFSRAK